MWSTILGWTAILAATAALTAYYNPQLVKKYFPATPPMIEKQPARKAKRTDHRDGKSAPTSSNEAPSKKRKIISAPVNETVTVTTTKGSQATIPRDDDGDMSNRAFAEQLVEAQAGTKLEKSAGSKEKSRTVKQGKAFESPNLSAGTSSAYADDDMSPVGSPPSGPVSTAPTSRAGDVSDMLEAPAVKPSTLRLTDTQEKAKKVQPKKAEEATTKKQRQRQKANEERAQQVAEADRLQKQMQDKQMKAARMAEGSSKQSKSNAFIPVQNAWRKPEAAAAQPKQPTQLLDTFEPKENGKNQDIAATHPEINTQENGRAVTTQPLSKITNGTTVNAAKEKQGTAKIAALAASTRERPDLSRTKSWADEVNDEEQSNWEKELQQDQQWESVTSKKKKKGRKDGDTSSEASEQVRGGNGTNGVKVDKKVENGTNGNRPESMNRFQSMERAGGSDWEA